MLLQENKTKNNYVFNTPLASKKSVKKSLNFFHKSLSSPQLIQCFMNADLRNGHDGLTAIAKNANIDVNKLMEGQYVIFINSSKNKIKLFASHNVVAYYRTRPGEVLNLNTISLIPAAFKSYGFIHYDDALKQAIENSLRKKGRN